MVTIAELQANVDVAQSSLKTWLDEQLVRIPDQAAWDALTQEEKIAEWDTKGKLEFALRTAKKALSTEQARRDAFYNARNDAFGELDAKYIQDKGVLSALWQEKEEHDFDIDYVPPEIL